jgi:hypothetical protein
MENMSEKIWAVHLHSISDQSKLPILKITWILEAISLRKAATMDSSWLHLSQHLGTLMVCHKREISLRGGAPSLAYLFITPKWDLSWYIYHKHPKNHGICHRIHLVFPKPTWLSQTRARPKVPKARAVEVKPCCIKNEPRNTYPLVITLW